MMFHHCLDEIAGKHKAASAVFGEGAVWFPGRCFEERPHACTATIRRHLQQQLGAEADTFCEQIPCRAFEVRCVILADPKISCIRILTTRHGNRRVSNFLKETNNDRSSSDLYDNIHQPANGRQRRSEGGRDRSYKPGVLCASPVMARPVVSVVVLTSLSVV